ncbi:MAG: hypothetical protein AAGC85_09065, partial [Bacteroidota bacterium]
FGENKLEFQRNHVGSVIPTRLIELPVNSLINLPKSALIIENYEVEYSFVDQNGRYFTLTRMKVPLFERIEASKRGLFILPSEDFIDYDQGTPDVVYRGGDMTYIIEGGRFISHLPKHVVNQNSFKKEYLLIENMLPPKCSYRYSVQIVPQISFKAKVTINTHAVGESPISVENDLTFAVNKMDIPTHPDGTHIPVRHGESLDPTKFFQRVLALIQSDKFDEAIDECLNMYKNPIDGGRPGEQKYLTTVKLIGQLKSLSLSRPSEYDRLNETAYRDALKTRENLVNKIKYLLKN